MPKNWFTIKAAQGDSPIVEVSILDYIGAWGVNAQSFLNDLKAAGAKTASAVKVFVNSPGGSVFEALAIFNGLRMLAAGGVKIEVHVLGVAASAASYIAMAGDKIVMPANTYLFIHNPINAVYGNAEDMRDMADLLDKIGGGLQATYAKRFKGEAAKLTEMLADETYLTAAECLEYGLCDEVIPEITAEAAFEVERLPEALRTVFAKAAQNHTPPVQHDGLAEYITQACKAAGIEAHSAVFAGDTKLTTREEVQVAVVEASTVLKLADMTGFNDIGLEAVRARKSLPEARAALAAAQAAKDAETVVNTAPPSKPAPKPGDGFSPTALWAQIHSMTGSKK
jgi:ATP-dependent Clp protease, protease subunit